jgi:dTDP-4-dehydrorhamnose 3,5-epimerase
VHPDIFSDERGYFLEGFNSRKYPDYGISDPFVQDNLVGSKRGVLRGLHYQIRHPQGKLVRAISGRIFDVAVDLRRHSPTFASWVGRYLDGESKLQLWVPPGFAHGYLVTSDEATVAYKVTDYYAPEWERTLSWNDPQVGVAWPLAEGQLPLLSSKDARGLPLDRAEVFDDGS